MFNSIAHFVVHRKKSALYGFVAVVIVFGAIGSMAFSQLTSGGYSDPKSESSRAHDYLTDHFGVKDPAIILIVDSGSAELNDPSIVASANKLESEIKGVEGITQTLSYWSAGGAPSLQSKDGHAAFLFAYANTDDFEAEGDIGKIVQEKFDGKFEGLKVYASGLGVISHAINTKISEDLALAESISVPLTFLLLAFVFGALVASAMPLLVGISAILGSFFLIYIFTLFTDVSIFALNLITGL